MSKNRYKLMKMFIKGDFDKLGIGYFSLTKRELKELLKAFDFYNQWNSGV